MNRITIPLAIDIAIEVLIVARAAYSTSKQIYKLLKG